MSELTGPDTEQDGYNHDQQYRLRFLIKKTFSNIVPVGYSLGDVVDVGTGGTGEPVAGVQPFLYLTKIVDKFQVI